MIEFKKDINRKKPPENENPKKILNIVEEILNFNSQQKGKGRSHMLALRTSDLACIAKVFDHSNLKILSPKQMLQRLPIALAQVEAGNSSENLLSKIRIIYYFYPAKEITKTSV